MAMATRAVKAAPMGTGSGLAKTSRRRKKQKRRRGGPNAGVEGCRRSRQERSRAWPSERPLTSDTRRAPHKGGAPNGRRTTTRRATRRERGPARPRGVCSRGQRVRQRAQPAEEETALRKGTPKEAGGRLEPPHREKRRQLQQKQQLGQQRVALGRNPQRAGEAVCSSPEAQAPHGAERHEVTGDPRRALAPAF